LRVCFCVPLSGVSGLVVLTASYSGCDPRETLIQPFSEA